MGGRRVSKEANFAEIHLLAQQSIGLPVPLDSAAVMTFRLQLARYQELNHQRAQLETKAKGL